LQGCYQNRKAKFKGKKKKQKAKSSSKGLSNVEASKPFTHVTAERHAQKSIFIPKASKN